MLYFSTKSQVAVRGVTRISLLVDYISGTFVVYVLYYN